MPSLPVSHICRDEASCLKVVAVAVLCYYYFMDLLLYVAFVKTDLVLSSSGADTDEIYSPFKHLSVKSLMNDHTSQYFITPAAEYFDVFTRFSSVFSFISPNMISFFHLFMAFLSARYVASDSLRVRRIGVLLFQFRTWLDAFDGVVYRSHSNTKGVYRSVHSTLGYYVDILCDCVGGVFLMVGVLFYLFRRFDPARHHDSHRKNVEAGTAGCPNPGSGPGVETYSKKMLFWKCWCYGLAIALAGKFWDNVVDDLRDIFQTQILETERAALQFELCHSNLNVLVMWLWRLVEGQALLQYVLLAIFLDRVWEFLNCLQYVAVSVITAMYIMSLFYIRHLRATLHM